MSRSCCSARAGGELRRRASLAAPADARLAGRGADRRARARAGRGGDRGRRRARRAGGPDLEGWDEPHRTRHVRRPPTRPTASPRRPRCARATGARRWTSTPTRSGSGAGAGAFEIARTRYRRDRLTVRHAHGYGVQTLADLGWSAWRCRCSPGAWLVAPLRATGLRRRDRGRPFDAERIGAADDGHGRRRSSRVHSLDRLDLVRPRHGRAWRCCAPAGSPGGVRCAGARHRREPLRVVTVPDRRARAPPRC